MYSEPFNLYFMVLLKQAVFDNVVINWKLVSMINPLADDKPLDGSKLKQIADDILKCI